MKIKLDNEFWQSRYKNAETGWDIGFPSPTFVKYCENEERKDVKILIPGCGNGYEAKWLWEAGFSNVFLLDWAAEPLDQFASENPSFPKNQLICEDFFAHRGRYELILEQTFFCAIDPSLRKNYVRNMFNLLAYKGRLVGLLFQIDFGKETPPYGGSAQEYRALFSPYFYIQKMETSHFSIPPRAGNELFINLQKR